MTPPTPQEAEIAGVAASLSREQRDAVLRADKPKPAYMFHDRYDGRYAVHVIRSTGLFKSKMGGAQCRYWFLTDAGKAVRAHLQRTQGESRPKETPDAE